MVCSDGMASRSRLVRWPAQCGRKLAASAMVLGFMGAGIPWARSAGFDEFVADPTVSVLQSDDAVVPDGNLDLGLAAPGSDQPLMPPEPAGDPSPPGEPSADGAKTYEISDLPGGVLAGPCPPAAPSGLLQRWQQNRKACWTVRTEAIALWRSAPASRPLFTSYDESTQTTGATVLNANQLESDAVAAPRVTLSWLDSCGRGVEATYLFAGNFFAANGLPFVDAGYAVAPPGIYGNVWGVDNTPISAVQQTLAANLNSAEINLREPIGWGSTRFLAGFRWIQWWETWSMADQFSDPNDSSVIGVDNYATQCVNNLYGGQIGLDSVLWNPGEGLRIESVVKAGAYYNAATQASAYSYATNTGFGFDRQVFVTGPGSASFVGEVGLTAVVPLRRNLDLRCGYFGLWLDSIAQPTNQLSGQTLTQIGDPAGTATTRGGVVLQGVTLGLEGRW